MKNMILSILLIFSAQAFAAQEGTCVPTKTVEEARADFDFGIQEATDKLDQDYARSVAEFEEGSTLVRQSHHNRITKARADFEARQKKIMQDLKPDWRAEMDQAAADHNRALERSSDQYKSDMAKLQEHYDMCISHSQARFDKRAEQLTNEYNQAVCAESASAE